MLARQADGQVILIHKDLVLPQDKHWILCAKRMVDLGESDPAGIADPLRDDLNVSEYFRQFVTQDE